MQKFALSKIEKAEKLDRRKLLNKGLFCGIPGLVVMGGGSCSEGGWFISQDCILDGDFFTFDLL